MVFCLLLGVLIFFFISFGLFKEKKDFSFAYKKVSPFLYERNKNGLKDILESGLFSQGEPSQLFRLINLEKEVLFLGINSRPDAIDFKSEAYIFFHDESEMVKLSKGSKLFLAFTKDGGLKLEKNETPLWIELKTIEKESASIELGVSLKKVGSGVFFEGKQKIILKEKGKPFQTSSSDYKALNQALSSAKWWGPDQLFQVYGGQAFEAFKALERIECSIGGQRLNIHVQEGDHFYWDGGGFLKQYPEGTEKPLPACLLRSIHFDKMEWVIWDETGLKQEVVTLKKERPQIAGLQLEKILTRMRLRTTSSVSCQLNHQTLLLKKGDWLFKTGSGWKILKTLKEIDEVLNFQLEGDLFVFDGIEKISNIPFFLGTLFDKARTTMQKVKFSLPEKKNCVDSLHTKNTNFSKLHNASQTKELLEAPNAFENAFEVEEKSK